MKTPSLRLATPDDAAQIQAIYAPYVTDTTISFETEAPSVAQMSERIASTLAFFPWLVCEESSEVLGYAYASAHRARAAYGWSVDVSVYVAPSHQRRGIGRQLYTELFSILVRQGFYHAFAGITLPNPASVGLHESLGFTPVGVYRAVGYKNGAWHDTGWWQKQLQPLPDAVPSEPRKIGNLRLASQSAEEHIASYFTQLIRRNHQTPPEDRLIYLVVAVRCQIDMGGFNSAFDQLLRDEPTQLFFLDGLRKLDEPTLLDAFTSAYVRLKAAGYFTDSDLSVFDLEEENDEQENTFLADIAEEIREGNRLWELDEKLCSLLPRA